MAYSVYRHAKNLGLEVVEIVSAGDPHPSHVIAGVRIRPPAGYRSEPRLPVAADGTVYCTQSWQLRILDEGWDREWWEMVAARKMARGTEKELQDA
jgi:hypothetical protein